MSRWSSRGARCGSPVPSGALAIHATAIALGVCVCACAKADAPAAASPLCNAPQGGAMAAAGLTEAYTRFAVALYPPMASAAGTGQNMVFSPYSIASTFTMVAGGAKGETEAQMQRVLQLPDTPASLAPAYAAVACGDETAAGANGNQLSIADAVWAQKSETFDPSYLALLSNGYGAPLQQIDFTSSPAAASATIDDWVSRETSGAIQRLLGANDLDANTKLLLVNAVYFRGIWADGFSPAETTLQPFTLLGRDAGSRCRP